MISVWLHQFDRAHIGSLEQLRAHWPGPIYLKALDAVSWMWEFDPSPFAVSGPSGANGVWTWSGLAPILPWTVPTGISDGDDEGAFTADLANEAGRVILDLEPYDHFWRGDRVDAERFVDAYRNRCPQPFWVSLDYRRLPFPLPVFHELTERYLPQCYWTTFQRPWLEVLEEAEARLTPYGKPVDYVLPGDANPEDLSAAIDWCTARGADASIWVWQTIHPENWDLLRARLETPSPLAPDLLIAQNSALINRLGYLQGDVALAIRSPLQRLRQRLRDRTSRGLIEAALAGVSTLEHEGR